eukprot:CAMPEP_0184013364 /NCGR_PEP_ID=MMETSP0954-20121128/4971_1 /TAXON_ID=627963 /ORGANISM="Aplanochytrium sp, Strain PBS07" /LENGTH=169 /DNA_ID=CAMNT_0026293543 /DNA_START=388 /DNA_END=894 /DNA_ORIENTATION=-
MARKRGGGRSARSGGLFGKKAAPASAPAPRRAPPAPTRAPPPARSPPPPAPSAPTPMAPQQSSGGGMLSGLGGMVAQGMAIGTGSALAHQAVNSVMGGSSSSHSAAPVESSQPVAQSAPTPVSNANDTCSLNQNDLYQCLQEQNGNASACQYYFDALKQCQDNQNQSSW